jgi:DNA-directed RNA polymerase specialized sigma subunit
MNQWDKSPYLSDNESPRNSTDTKVSRSSRISEQPIVWKNENSLRQSEEFYRKTLSESRKMGLFLGEDLEDDDNNDEDEGDLEILKKSLGSVLQDLSDKERLTDDEYQDKVHLIL